MSARSTFQMTSGCGCTLMVLAGGILLANQASGAVVIFVLSVISVFVFAGWLTALFQMTSGNPQHAIRSWMGWGLTVSELARRLDLSEQQLINHFPKYIDRPIPKRSGGTRILRIPDATTADIQKRILQRLLPLLTSHRCATGFEAGLSIVDNALPHVGQAVVIKLDLVDFFPNTHRDRLELYFRRIGWGKEAASILVRLTCDEEGLPQGACTSPRLSNLVNFLMDEQLDRLAKSRKGVYTRYADDITFSFPKDYPQRVRGIILKTRWIVRRFGYQLNSKKQLILRQHQRQSVTGLNVNTKACLPRELRRRLRAARHRMKTTGSATWTEEQLQGWASLESMVESQTASESER
ncbi:Reverse transcriptase (RNA-dependent DNA polymerase) [Thalassoglobus neptunius]|uniref:RNA-directed DNA polymerase n=1 Tax=Thalassoglobus neptunius TaxID=1938619 RepID=A0A5C5WG89_9PLAN|nr:reverse transcriptase family protein [Thalassoglobus neptunius]TWT49794.1 Reverse transcriptase (RNA-dependent DNA polymerase) [Thalassoglobus neptunius]